MENKARWHVRPYQSFPTRWLRVRSGTHGHMWGNNNSSQAFVRLAAFSIGGSRLYEPLLMFIPILCFSI
jgi:hypothetical protein